MAILLDTKNRVFTLQTNHSMYQMKADRYGVLLHTLFGEKGSVFDYSYLITYADRGFSGNPYDVDDKRTYSLDALPQEYPACGSGDYRGSAEFDTYNRTRLLLGINPGNFNYRLNPGETFCSPEVAMAYSGEGLEHLSHIFHRAFRNNLCRGKFKKARRPVLLNSW